MGYEGTLKLYLPSHDEPQEDPRVVIQHVVDGLREVFAARETAEPVRGGIKALMSITDVLTGMGYDNMFRRMNVLSILKELGIITEIPEERKANTRMWVFKDVPNVVKSISVRKTEEAWQRVEESRNESSANRKRRKANVGVDVEALKLRIKELEEQNAQLEDMAKQQATKVDEGFIAELYAKAEAVAKERDQATEALDDARSELSTLKRKSRRDDAEIEKLKQAAQKPSSDEAFKAEAAARFDALLNKGKRTRRSGKASDGD